ncbi:Por secretion system C-terminal sorting domain-containing protein [Fibrobacter sp. UWP2]|jgi:pectate lyase|nr:Por secretion system C-terminal sorting domain-containing protein [Fibrobacter sp. UWP2]
MTTNGVKTQVDLKKGCNMKFLNMTLACLGLVVWSQAQVTLGDAAGWLETAYVEWADNGADSYNVYYSGEGKTNVKLDAQLVRKYGSKMRADAVGLKAGTYTLKVVPVKGGSEGTAATTSALTVKAHDRAGFAFSNGRVPGAYNTDGTLKNGAVVLYISESTKNTVTLDVTTNSKGTQTTCKSFQGILNCMKKGYETRPVDFRFVGNVTDSDSLVAGDMVADLGSSETTFLTIEGVGADAVANGWGIRLKNAQNVEIRNMGFMNVDSDEGDNIGLQQNDQYIWVHNNDFFYGHAGSDKDQVKGDGALDCKKSTYVTFSYNHFWDSGKSNLLGLSEGTTEGLYITYHHNWYDHSDSRHPRVRFYSAHVYNNYYDGNSKYGAGSTLGSSVFMENNYFRNCKYPMMTSMQGSDVYAGGTTRDTKNNPTFSSEDGGTIKAFGNYMEGSYTFIPYGASSYKVKGSETTAASQGINTVQDFDAYVVDSRDAKVPSSVKSYAGANVYNNFDTDNSVMYSYKADDAATARDNVVRYAGRVQGGDFKWTFNNDVDDASSDVNQALKDAVVAYKGWSGSAIPVSSSSSSDKSSSSSVPASSSSSVNSSSSETVPVSSSVSGTAIEGDIVHNFTTDGKASDFFTITGNLSKDKGSVTYGGETLTQCLKLESATEISFTLSSAATMTLVLNADFNGAVKVNGEKYTAVGGIVTVELSAGANTITKGDSGNLFLISIKNNGSGSGTPQAIASVKNVQNPVVYSARDAKLVVNAGDVRHVGIVRMDGRKVDAFAVQKGSFGSVYDLSALRPGVYVVRVVTSDGAYLRKILKK